MRGAGGSEDGAWKVRKPNNQGGMSTVLEIDNDEMGLYHVKTPTNAVHAANKQYVDERVAQRDSVCMATLTCLELCYGERQHEHLLQ